MDEIFSYIRSQRNEYETKDIPLFEGMDFSQYDTINQIDHYWVNSYLEEASDDIIGDYPFDNVSKFRVLLETRATDFDTKHITVEPDRPDKETRVRTMISTKALSRWMRKYKFAKTINDICLNRAKYGGVLTTHVKKEGIFAIPWQNIISDQSDMMAGVRIIRHYFTPADMLRKEDIWQNVKDAVKTAEAWRDKGMADRSADQAQTQGDLIEVFELQGDVKVSMLKGAQALMNGEEYEEDEDDCYTYAQVRIFVCGADWVDKDSKEESGIVLYADEEETTHNYLARNPITGRALGEGVVETLFEHQKWHNFTKTEEMRMIAIAGKKLYWTDDPDILSNIFDEGIDHGTVLRVGSGKTLSELNQLPTGIPVYQAMRQDWDESADKVTSSFDAKIGEEAKSGTPFRAQYMQNVEASSQFEQYREEIGFLLEELVTNRALPEALEELAEEDDLYEAFSPQELMLIDEVIINKNVTSWFLQQTLSRKVIAPEQIEEMKMKEQRKLSLNGNKRLIKEIREFITESVGFVQIHTTDEARNKAVYFESLSNALALLAPEDPRRNALIDRILMAIGISKEELEMYMEQGILPAANPKLETKQAERAQQTGVSVLPTGV